MSYSWHEEYYKKAMKDILKTAGKKCQYSQYKCEGWTDWFEQNHPELYKKFTDASVKALKLCGNMEPGAMEEFKSCVKIEIEATKWAIDKYLEFQKQKTSEEAFKGTQEALTLK